MAVTTLNVSLPQEMKRFIESRIRSGQYGNASDVVRAGLRALAREEMGPSVAQFDRIMSELPQDEITEEIEQEVEALVREARQQDGSKKRR